MVAIKELIEEVKQDMDAMEFHQVLYETREKLGLRLYRVAEHANMTMGRLKRLEAGMFCTMPDRSEIDSICGFYGLPVEKMIDKAAAHVARHTKTKKADRYIDG